MMEYEFDELVRPIPEGPDWWSSIRRFPVKITDQSFGYELFKSDMIHPDKVADVSPWPITQERTAKGGYSWVVFDEQGFQVELSMCEFKDHELEVKIEKGFLVIHGEHEDRVENNGVTSRSFTRRYMLPFDCDTTLFEPQMVPGSAGTVTIKLPRKVEKEQNGMVMDKCSLKDSTN